MYNFSSTTRITQEQLGQIHELESVCRAFDKTKGSISLAQELNFRRDMECFFFAYEGSCLIGLVSVFAPIKGLAELSALVHPQHRRQGVFTSLLSQAAAVLKRYDIIDVFFVHDSAGESGRAVMEKWALPADHSEYLLKYDDRFSAEPKQHGINIKETSVSDIEVITQLSLDIFGGDRQEWEGIHEKSFLSPNISCYGAYMDGAIIGTANVNDTQQGLFIFSFGIAPAYRRRGLGRAFLAGVIKQLREEHNADILLEVDSENNSACMLYTTGGFNTEVQFDYYKSSLEDVLEKTGRTF